MKLLISVLIVSGVVFIIGFAVFALAEAQPAEDLTLPEPAEDLTLPEPIINDSNEIKTSNYSLIKEWGSRSKSDIQFSHPGDIAVDSLNFVYVYGSSGNVQKYDDNGTFITEWGSEDWEKNFAGGGSLDDIAFDHSGNVYIADSGNNRIQKFDNNGTFITNWETILPKGIGVDSLGNVYVSNSRTDHTVKIFGPSSDR